MFPLENTSITLSQSHMAYKHVTYFRQWRVMLQNRQCGGEQKGESGHLLDQCHITELLCQRQESKWNDMYSSVTIAKEHGLLTMGAPARVLAYFAIKLPTTPRCSAMCLAPGSVVTIHSHSNNFLLWMTLQHHRSFQGDWKGVDIFLHLLGVWGTKGQKTKWVGMSRKKKPLVAGKW